MAQLVNDFDIGCDPEFVVLDASGAFVTVEDIGFSGSVGYDHGGACVELRPQKARGTYTLLKRLRMLLGDAKLKYVAKHRWRSGAWIKDRLNKTMAIGGHIHFDVPGMSIEQCKALDILVEYLERAELLPRQESVARRTSTSYGKFNAFRFDNAHTEYRTPASWLHHPRIAFTVLTAAKLVVVSPETAAEYLKKRHNGSVDRASLIKFFENFRHKDVNAARAVSYFEQPHWMDTPPDTDIKTAWRIRV